MSSLPRTARACHRAAVKSQPGAPEVRQSRQSKSRVKFGLQPETVYRPFGAGMKRGIHHFSV